MFPSPHASCADFKWRSHAAAQTGPRRARGLGYRIGLAPEDNRNIDMHFHDFFRLAYRERDRTRKPGSASHQLLPIARVTTTQTTAMHRGGWRQALLRRGYAPEASARCPAMLMSSSKLVGIEGTVSSTTSWSGNHPETPFSP